MHEHTCLGGVNLPAHLVIIKVSQIMYIKVHKFAEEITHFFTCAIDVRKNWELSLIHI